MNRQTIAIIILVGILIALGVLWYYYISRRSIAEDGQISGIDIGAYERVKNLQLDAAFLRDPVFRELKPEVIPPPATESIGRSNPFLPF